MIARQDNENLHLIYSDHLNTWGSYAAAPLKGASRNDMKSLVINSERIARPL